MRSVLSKNTTQSSQPGLKPGPPNPELSTLTIKPPHFPQILVNVWAKIHTVERWECAKLARSYATSFTGWVVFPLIISSWDTPCYAKTKLRLFFTLQQCTVYCALDGKGVKSALDQVNHTTEWFPQHWATELRSLFLLYPVITELLLSIKFAGTNYMPWWREALLELNVN